MNIKIKRFDKSLPLPEYDKGAACFDLLCRQQVTIKPKETKLVPVNIAVQIPSGYTILIFVRSSTPIKKGLTLANSVGVIDPFYRGEKDEVLVEFFNLTDKPVIIEKGEKLAQGMVVKCEIVRWQEVDEMKET